MIDPRTARLTTAIAQEYTLGPDSQFHTGVPRGK
jgi:hypothetical protein